MANEHKTAISPHSILVDWANSQPGWVRGIVGEVLRYGQELSEDRVAFFYELLLVEKQLKDGEPVSVPYLQKDTKESHHEEAFVLSRLTEVENVNALASGQRIEFNPRLTIFFGENGTGKSGYVRILKRLASVRTAETILPNIHAIKPAGTPKAKITYRLGTSEHSYGWQNEDAVHPFTLMDVFDARSTHLHVDDELSYVYTPRELSLFTMVHDALQAVRGLLDAAKTEATPTGNPFQARFNKASRIYPKIETLGPTTDMSELERLASVSKEEEESLQPLRDRVDALRSKTAETRLELAKSDCTLYENALRVFTTARTFNHASYNSLLAELHAAKDAHTNATKQAFADEQIPGVLGEAWKDFIAAGEEYLGEIERRDYPIPDDRCIYCQQPLTDAAVQLLRKYRDFCNNELKKAVDKTRRKLSQTASDVKVLDVEGLLQHLNQKLAAIEPTSQQASDLRKLCDSARRVQGLVTSVADSQPTTDDELPHTMETMGQFLQKQIEQTQQFIAQLENEKKQRDVALQEDTATLTDLEARLALRELLPAVKAHVESAKWAFLAKAHIDSFRGMLKSLTEQSKLASEDLLNKDFEELFYAECTSLRAPEVKLDFPGRKGQAVRRKSLAADYKLGDVLSEGEQKVIALADFVAEALLKETTSPVVFDDPVTSLDYRRLSHVVNRIVEMSTTRQVIVFTHNIWFTMELLAKFDKNTCFYYDVSDDQDVRGIISRGQHPRADTVKSLRGKINDLIQNANSATGETQNALIEQAYSTMRSLCEVVVETELLQGVTQRYQPNVMMTKLSQIRGERLENATNAIVPIFEKCCRYMPGHSQPLETLNVRPTLSELRKDWEDLQKVREEYSA